MVRVSNIAVLVMVLAGSAAAPKAVQAAGLMDRLRGLVGMGTTPPARPPVTDAVETKLQGPIACINRALTGLELFRTRYQAAAAQFTRPATGSAPAVDFSDRPYFKVEPYERDNEFVLACADGLETSAAAAPAIPDMDAASRALAPLLRAMIPAGNQAEAYYGQEDWKDDHGAKARTLDATLGAQLAQLAQLDAQLRAAVLREQATARQRQLDAIEQKDGRDYGWHALKLMQAARQMEDGIGAAVVAGRLDAGTAGATIAPLQAEWDAGSAYAAAHQRQAAPNANGMRPLWFDLLPAAGALLQQAKELRRTLPDLAGTPEGASRINDSLQAINMSFNSLVDTFNTVARLH